MESHCQMRINTFLKRSFGKLHNFPKFHDNHINGVVMQKGQRYIHSIISIYIDNITDLQNSPKKNVLEHKLVK